MFLELKTANNQLANQGQLQCIVRFADPKTHTARGKIPVVYHNYSCSVCGCDFDADARKHIIQTTRLQTLGPGLVTKDHLQLGEETEKRHYKNKFQIGNR